MRWPESDWRCGGHEGGAIGRGHSGYVIPICRHLEDDIRCSPRQWIQDAKQHASTVRGVGLDAVIVHARTRVIEGSRSSSRSSKMVGIVSEVLHR